MLVIRLSRQGRKNLAHYKLLVQEKTAPVKSGKYIEIIGHYDPADEGNKLVFKQDRLEHFLKNGAQPSNTVARLLMKAGVDEKLVGKAVKKYTKQKLKKETTAESSAAAKSEEGTAEEEEVKEAPVEEKQSKVDPTEEKKTEEKDDKPVKEDIQNPEEKTE